jgi:DNA adenine methylase
MISQLFPYAGSSRRYARVLAEIMRREDWESYAEPFVGSGALFFTLCPPARADIGDLEFHIFNLYTQVRDQVDSVCEILRTLVPIKERFLEIEEEIHYLSYGPEAAAKWYYLILLTFNGIVRKRKTEDGQWRPWFTWGTGHQVWDKNLEVYIQRLRIASQLLQETGIWLGDYSRVPEADMAFFDPPWFGGKEKQYGVLDDFDYERLRDYLALYPGKWILTINDTPETRNLFLPIARWQAPVKQFYGIAPTSEGKVYKSELVLANFSPKMYGG